MAVATALVFAACGAARAQMLSGRALADSLRQGGYVIVMRHASSPELPPDAAAEKRWAFGDARHNRVSAEEVVLWRKAAEQALQTGPVAPALPVAVVIAGRGAGGPMKQVYQEPARRSGHGYFAEVRDAGHADLLGRRHAAEIVKAIDSVLGAIRSGPGTTAWPAAAG